MPSLHQTLRKQLENVVVAARDKAEEAAISALQKRAVDVAEPFAYFKAEDKQLRNRLRARARQAGDDLDGKTQQIELVSQELAYEYWHRMLFARFLAENHLLMHPDGVAVSLGECEELAHSLPSPGTPGEGLGVRVTNGWQLAASYACRMLPEIFRVDDVLLEVEFSPEHRIALEKLLASLPSETFVADDSLGWVYQFWQSKRKEEVNRSEKKIGAREISPVTQLFTEDYMVDFLLQNTLGAWARENLTTEAQRHRDERRTDSSSVPLCLCGSIPVPYMRLKEDGLPAAGTFQTWPKSLAQFKLLDPSCGSGHFLVAALRMLVPLRMQDEGLSEIDAISAVFRDNLFGLEIDPRCAQIAAFNLARGKQDGKLKKYLEKNYAEGKADLATAFVQRCLELCDIGGTTALVTPQNWLFLTTYTKLREKLLKEC